MNAQVAFVYCFLTILVIYLALFLEQRYLSDNSKNNNSSGKHLRISILCGLLNWIIIVYFIYQIEINVPNIMSNTQVSLQDKF